LYAKNGEVILRQTVKSQGH